jgi:hypothetical protein
LFNVFNFYFIPNMRVLDSDMIVIGSFHILNTLSSYTALISFVVLMKAGCVFGSAVCGISQVGCRVHILACRTITALSLLAFRGSIPTYLHSCDRGGL